MQRVHALRQSQIQVSDASSAVSAEHGIDLAPANVQIRMMVHRFGLVRHSDHKLNAGQIGGKAIAAGNRSVANEAPAIQLWQDLRDLVR